MAPRSEYAGFGVDTGFPCNLPHKKGWDEIANLAQDIKLVVALDYRMSFFHLLCVEQLRLQSNAIFSVGCYWGSISNDISNALYKLLFRFGASPPGSRTVSAPRKARSSSPIVHLLRRR